MTISKQSAEELRGALNEAYRDALDEARIEQQLPAEMKWALFLERVRGLATALLNGLPK